MRKTNNWCDFYIFVPRSDHITYEDRIGLTEKKAGGKLVTRDILDKDEEIVQMIFDDYGGLGFWTNKKAWTIRTAGDTDRLISMERNPSEE